MLTKYLHVVVSSTGEMRLDIDFVSVLGLYSGANMESVSGCTFHFKAKSLGMERGNWYFRKWWRSQGGLPWGRPPSMAVVYPSRFLKTSQYSQVSGHSFSSWELSIVTVSMSADKNSHSNSFIFVERHLSGLMCDTDSNELCRSLAVLWFRLLMCCIQGTVNASESYLSGLLRKRKQLRRNAINSNGAGFWLSCPLNIANQKPNF